VKQAKLIEIFSSMQGEGPHVGEPMVFVRFQHCALSCKFCDTPASFQKFARFRWERPEAPNSFSAGENPVSLAALTALVERYGVKTLSLTGGEPLQQAEFIQAWLPTLGRKFKILLETNGVLPQALASVIEWVDIVSMDMKLPSVTGMRAYWEEHEAFLEIARQKEVYIKAVVSNSTELGEVQRALEICRRLAPEAPFVLQPVTPAWEVLERIPEEKLKALYEFSLGQVPDVRVIPQVHALLGIL